MRKIISLSLLLLCSAVFALPIKPVWKASAGSTNRPDLQLMPTFYNDMVITTDSRGMIYANKKTDGQRLWRINTKQSLTTGAAINQYAIVVATHQAQVLAFHPVSHQLMWSYSLDSEVLASPAIHQRSVVVKTVDGQITVFDAKTGQVNWRYNHGSNNEIVLHASSSPLVTSERLISGFSDGNLLAFNTRNGQLLWQSMVAGAKGISQIDQVVDVTAKPIIRGNVIYVANYQGKIKALDLKTGQALWARKLSTYHHLAIDKKQIYAVDESGQVLAYRLDDGAVLWRQPKFSGNGLSSPAVNDDAVIIGDKSGHLYWLDKKDGHVLASNRAVRSAIRIAPIVEGKSVYVLSQRGELSKFNVG